MDARSGTELGESDGPIKGPSSSLPEPVAGSPLSPQQAYRAPPQQRASLHGELARIASLDDEVQTGDKWAARPTTREGAAGVLSSERAIAMPTEARVATTPTPKVPLRTETANPALPIIAREQQAPPESSARWRRRSPGPSRQLGGRTGMRAWDSRSGIQRMCSRQAKTRSRPTTAS